MISYTNHNNEDQKAPKIFALFKVCKMKLKTLFLSFLLMTTQPILAMQKNYIHYHLTLKKYYNPDAGNSTINIHKTIDSHTTTVHGKSITSTTDERLSFNPKKTLLKPKSALRIALQKLLETCPKYESNSQRLDVINGSEYEAHLNSEKKIISGLYNNFEIEEDEKRTDETRFLTDETLLSNIVEAITLFDNVDQPEESSK